MSTDSPRTHPRGTPHTPRSLRARLGLSLVVSLALHGSLFAIRITPPRLPDLHLDINPTVELGFEVAVPGADHPPSAPPSITPEAPPPRPAPRPHRVHHAPVVAPSPPLELPTPPDIQLREPTLARETPSNTMLFDHDAATAADDVMLAQNEDASLDDVQLAVADASASDAEGDASGGIPALASESELAAAVPQGSVVTMLLRTDRLRENPNGRRVRDLMLEIPDWQAVLGGTEIDPVRDFDQVLLASANPFGTATQAPDVMALVRLHADRRFVRASIEQMAGVRAQLGPDAGTLYERFQQPDAGRMPSPTRPIWQSRNGAEIATINRYLGPHAFMLLGNDTAAIAAPERVPALLAVLSRRPAIVAAQAAGDPNVVALLQANGMRNLINAPPGPVNPIPVSVDLVVLATRGLDGGFDGGATLTSRWRYENNAQAQHMVRMSEVALQDVSHAVNDFERTTGGRVAALSGTVHFDRLRRVIAALRARAEGAEMRLDAELTREEVAELLNLQRLAAAFQ